MMLHAHDNSLDQGRVPLKVFVIDDDSAMRLSLDSVLRSVGYEVELFESGAEFLGAAQAQSYGCIVLDVRRPGPSGLEIQKRLGEAGIRMPVVFVTGHGDIAMAVQAMKAGAIEFLTKPFRDQDLLDAIGRAVEREQARLQADKRRAFTRTLIDSLSPREQEVFSLLCQGQLGKQIAHRLAIAEATGKVHRRNIMAKLGATRISQLFEIHRFLADGDG